MEETFNFVKFISDVCSKEHPAYLAEKISAKSLEDAVDLFKKMEYRFMEFFGDEQIGKFISRLVSMNSKDQKIEDCKGLIDHELDNISVDDKPSDLIRNSSWKTRKIITDLVHKTPPKNIISYVKLTAQSSVPLAIVASSDQLFNIFGVKFGLIDDFSSRMIVNDREIYNNSPY